MLMTHWADLFFLIGFLFFATPLLGNYLYRLYSGQRTFLHPLLSPIEQGIYRLLGVDHNKEMSFRQYTYSLCLLHCVGFVGLFTLIMLQGVLFSSTAPITTPPSWSLAMNIAISFLTNTNWQAYTPETTLTNSTQLFGLTVQQFLSPSVGLAGLLAFIRGIASRGGGLAGNFWVDLIRSLLYLLFPLSLLLSCFLLEQGSIATYADAMEYTTLEGKKEKVILGPVAAQTAIMHLGTNGGAFFNSSSSHPFINPTDSSNVILTLALLFIPAAIPHLYGEMIGNKKEGWLLFICMLSVWLGGSLLAEVAQARQNPFYKGLELIEGQETRIGQFSSVLWGTSTTATANGSVNSSSDSLAPLAGGFLLINLMLGETLFGGIGVCLTSLLFFVLLTLFLSGLMVGRSAEYQGKKIGQRHMQWVMCALLVPTGLVLLSVALCILIPGGLNGITSRGPHAFTSLFYAITSCCMNNGSAFTSFASNSTGYHFLFAFLMLMGRMIILLPGLALGALFAAQVPLSRAQGTFSTTSPLFLFLLTGVLLTYGLLSFFSGWILGPFSEQILLDHGLLW